VNRLNEIVKEKKGRTAANSITRNGGNALGTGAKKDEGQEEQKSVSRGQNYKSNIENSE